MKKHTLIAAVLGAMAISGAANAMIIDCAVVQNSSAAGWIMDREIFNYDPDAGTATVLDGMTQALLGGAIPAKVVGLTKKKVGFSWRVQSSDNSGQQVNMVYRASYFFDTKKVTVTAVPPGYSNQFEGRGTCKVK